MELGCEPPTNNHFFVFQVIYNYSARIEVCVAMAGLPLSESGTAAFVGASREDVRKQL